MPARSNLIAKSGIQTFGHLFIEEKFMMRNLLRYGLAAVVLTFVFSVFSAVPANAQINEVLKRMDDNYKLLTSLRTNVKYEKYDSGLKDSETMEGKAIYLPQKGKNAYFRVDWKAPDESLAVVNKQYVIYRPKLRQAYVGNTDKKLKNSSGVSGPLAFLNMSKAQMKENYKMRYLGEETLSNGTSVWHLELTPIKAQSYKLAEIWVDKDGMPVQMKTVENNNDTSTVLLGGLEKNITLKGADFKIDLPEGTKIIKN
jgi:outer membrane lipoprotein-sorting protein